MPGERRKLKQLTTGLSESLHEEIKSFGLHSICFDFGYFRTNLLTDDHLGAGKDHIADYKPVNDRHVAQLRGKCSEVSLPSEPF